MLRRELKYGYLENDDAIILNDVSYLFVKNKQSSLEEGYIIINDNNMGISLEVGEKKFYSSDFIDLGKVEIICGNNSIIEFEYY